MSHFVRGAFYETLENKSGNYCKLYVNAFVCSFVRKLVANRLGDPRRTIVLCNGGLQLLAPLKPLESLINVTQHDITNFNFNENA